MKKILLIFILILASVLRLYDLTSYPSGLNADEAALGYNAYSIMLTGRDEHGHFLPINLESFGDFKPALYSYLLIPFIKVMGLTELAVRLPSAIFGILAVLFIYLLTNLVIPTDPEPAEGERRDPSTPLGMTAGHVAALLLAISPWHLHFSRGAWEVNVATTLLLIGVWLFLRWARLKNNWSIFFSIFCFSLSMYTYQSTRIIAPLIGLGLAAIYFKDLASRPKLIILNLLFTLILLSPLAYNVLTTDSASRFSGVGFTADEGPLNRIKEFRGQHSNPASIMARILHNRVVIYSIQFAKNYLDHFGGNFLFVNGDIIQRNRIPETGLLYLTDFIFVVLGLIYLIQNLSAGRQGTKYKIQVILLWLLIAPIAAALTFQTPHALRSQNMIIPITILTAAGIYWIIKRWQTIGGVILVIFYLFQVTRYIHQYYVHYPKEYPAAWEFGFKEVVAYAESKKEEYDRVLVTDKYDQPYILFLFYSKYPPHLFQGQHQLTVRDKFNFSTVRDYDKYHFESTPWDKVRDNHSSLIIAAPEDIPAEGVNVVNTIYFPNGEEAFKIVSN